jgi:hypothetical protein
VGWWTLQWGSSAEVLEPQSLRREMAETARKLVEVGVIALFPRHVQTGSGNRRCYVSRTSGRQEWGWQEGAHLVK